MKKPLKASGTSSTLYYGWRIAWALAVTQTVGYGVLYYAFGVFVTPMETELGWSRVGTVPLHALVLRRGPRDLSLEPDGLTQQSNLSRTDPEPSVGTREALKGRGFWWLSAAFALSRLSFAAMGAHLVPLLLERGFTPAFAAVAVGTVGPLQLLGRLAFLPSSARWSLHRVTVTMFVCLTLAFLSLLFVPGVAGVWLFVTLYGASNGATTLSRAGLVAERYGPAHYGSINGVVALVVAVVGAFAPLGAGVLYAFSNGYEVVLWALVAASLGAVVAVIQTPAAPTEVRSPRPTSSRPEL